MSLADVRHELQAAQREGLCGDPWTRRWADERRQHAHAKIARLVGANVATASTGGVEARRLS